MISQADMKFIYSKWNVSCSLVLLENLGIKLVVRILIPKNNRFGDDSS